MTIVEALLAAGQRLAEALRAENEALAAMDLEGAARLAPGKIQASDAFAAAYAAASRTGAKPDGRLREATVEMAERLDALGTENRRLLERAIAVQSQVIESIAAAASAARGGSAAGYGASGKRPVPRRADPLALTTRA